MFTLGVNCLSIVLHVFTYFILSSNIACEGHIIFLEMMYYLSQFWIMYFFVKWFLRKDSSVILSKATPYGLVHILHIFYLLLWLWM